MVKTWIIGVGVIAWQCSRTSWLAGFVCSSYKLPKTGYLGRLLSHCLSIMVSIWLCSSTCSARLTIANVFIVISVNKYRNKSPTSTFFSFFFVHDHWDLWVLSLTKIRRYQHFSIISCLFLYCIYVYMPVVVRWLWLQAQEDKMIYKVRQVEGNTAFVIATTV